jgi:hypothetical protein
MTDSFDSLGMTRIFGNEWGMKYVSYCQPLATIICATTEQYPHSMRISERFLCLLFVFLITVGCQKKETPIRQISISVNNNAEDYSTLIKSYEVIPLDNNPEAYFRFSQDALLGENIWLFCNPNDAKIVVLDNKGKFLNTIGKKGRGPGEINYVSDYNFDPKDNSVTIYDRSKAKKFLVNGSFVEEHDLGFIPTKIIKFGDNQFIVEKHMPAGDTLTDFELRLTDKDFNTIDKRLPQKNIEYYGASLYGQSSRCQENKDYAYYFSLSGDTIFHIRNGKIYPAYLLSYDKDIFIQQIFTEANPGTDSQENKDRYEQLNYFENDENCFVFFHNIGVSYCIIFNPESNRTRLFKNAIVPISVSGNQLIIIANSFYLEKIIAEYIDPDRNKCSNKQILDSLIANSINDFEVLLKINIHP